MYYIESIRDGVCYVRDTSDQAIEGYSINDLKIIQKRYGIEVKGYSDEQVIPLNFTTNGKLAYIGNRVFDFPYLGLAFVDRVNDFLTEANNFCYTSPETAQQASKGISVGDMKTKVFVRIIKGVRDKESGVFKIKNINAIATYLHRESSNVLTVSCYPFNSEKEFTGEKIEGTCLDVSQPSRLVMLLDATSKDIVARVQDYENWCVPMKVDYEIDAFKKRMVRLGDATIRNNIDRDTLTFNDLCTGSTVTMTNSEVQVIALNGVFHIDMSLYRQIYKKSLQEDSQRGLVMAKLSGKNLKDVAQIREDGSVLSIYPDENEEINLTGYKKLLRHSVHVTGCRKLFLSKSVSSFRTDSFELDTNKLISHEEFATFIDTDISSSKKLIDMISSLTNYRTLNVRGVLPFKIEINSPRRAELLAIFCSCPYSEYLASCAIYQRLVDNIYAMSLMINRVLLPYPTDQHKELTLAEMDYDIHKGIETLSGKELIYISNFIVKHGISDFDTICSQGLEFSKHHLSVACKWSQNPILRLVDLEVLKLSQWNESAYSIMLFRMFAEKAIGNPDIDKNSEEFKLLVDNKVKIEAQIKRLYTFLKLTGNISKLSPSSGKPKGVYSPDGKQILYDNMTINVKNLFRFYKYMLSKDKELFYTGNRASET